MPPWPQELKKSLAWIGLKGINIDFAAFLLEHQVAVLSLEEFQEVGLAYEYVHGPAKPIVQASTKHSGSFESCAAHSSTSVELMTVVQQTSVHLSRKG